MASSRHEKKADLYRVLKDAWGIHEDAASAMFARGSVSIDGHVVPATWARGHWTEQQLRGRMLSCVRGSVRLYGPMSVVLYEQMRLG